jgi:hypothetical protein
MESGLTTHQLSEELDQERGSRQLSRPLPRDSLDLTLSYPDLEERRWRSLRLLVGLSGVTGCQRYLTQAFWLTMMH